MARWRLLEPHYLNVPGTKWEYQETDRTTGRQVRKSFDVPTHYHPDIEADWTERDGLGMGFVAVSDGHNSKPSDVIFKGEPTPGMLPLDDEAKEISARYQEKWTTPGRLYDEAEGGYAQRMMDQFVESQGKVNMLLAENREIPGMSDFMQVMTNMMKQNQQILQILAEKAVAKELGITQEVDDLEPLPPVAEPPPRRVVGRRA